MVGLTGDIGTFTQEKNLGPDALDLRYEQFQKILSGKRGSVKSILMNQGILSGIGNIYSDEILFQAGIYPKGRIEKMEEKSIHTLYDTIKEVLETAIEVRADVDNLPRTYLIPHREKGGICPKCGHTLTPIRVVGRTAYYCPEHQRV
jgi:formamidopyrimidine-DNA glycosylase